jgi:hypothetical protein
LAAAAWLSNHPRACAVCLRNAVANHCPRAALQPTPRVSAGSRARESVVVVVVVLLLLLMLLLLSLLFV